MNETEMLDWLRPRLASGDPSVLVGSGPDDCAHVLAGADSRLAITSDSIVEGVHFTAEDAPEHVGWKAAAVNISDLAASGCEPRWAVVNLCLRRGRSDEYTRALAQGLLECAHGFGLSIVGGDTVTVDGPTSLSVTAIGRPLTTAPLLRDGAQVGDALVVTGALGGAIHGRHLEVTPRMHEIRRIVERACVHACLDISDGLALDLSRMLKESHVGAIVERNRVPVSPDVSLYPADDAVDALSHALSDGEDFELLLAVAQSEWTRLEAQWSLEDGLAPLTRIGTITDASGKMLLQDGEGECRPLEPRGYMHEF